MTTTINASTSSGLVVTPDNSGNVMLQYNGVSTPAFGAYASTTTLLVSGSSVKVAFAGEEYDTANFFNTSTSVFQPTIAGYYQINAAVTVQATGSFYMLAFIYKNGSTYRQGSCASGNASAYNIGQVNSLVYMNGTTDYLEIYAAQNSGSNINCLNTSANTYWNGFLVRGA